MSLFNLGAGPSQPAGNGTAPPAVSSAKDPSQTAGPAQHNTAASSAIEQQRAAEIDAADAWLAELDGTRGRMRALPASTAEPRSRVSGGRTDAPAPPNVDVGAALVQWGGRVPDGHYIAAWSDQGKPVLREKTTGKLLKGSGALPGAGRGRAPGLAKMVQDIVHFPAIIQFLQDVAVGKLAAGTKMTDRIKAAEILLDRRFGKPTQHVELKDEAAQSEARREMERMTTAQLASTVEQLRALMARKDEIVTDAEIVEE